MLCAALCLLGSANAAVPAPRAVRVSGTEFILTATNRSIVLSGPNVVVKGPPYLPSTEGEHVCHDVVNDHCQSNGTCTTCYSFTEGDVKHMKREGWNTIRLGVVWAGAQPRDEDSLDPDFVRRLKSVLALCDKTGMHVILDNHGDMVGTAGCGNGVPMWFQRKAAGDEIGKPLRTGFPYDLVEGLQVQRLDGYERCGNNATNWAKHAGDPNYNLLNECCQAMNTRGNPIQLGTSTVNVKTMDYLVKAGAGRDAFARFWRLLAQVAAPHPSAFAAELMNEPVTVRRSEMFDTWRAAAEAINSVVPDMAVALADPIEGALIPSWVAKLVGAGVDISRETVEWIKRTDTLFYPWHWYGNYPKTVAAAIRNVQELSREWNLPTFATEFMSCDVWNETAAHHISHTYWHYSSYCDTDPAFGNRTAPQDTFGACFLGWESGNSDYKC
jgi:hypothetical protein